VHRRVRHPFQRALRVARLHLRRAGALPPLGTLVHLLHPGARLAAELLAEERTRPLAVTDLLNVYGGKVGPNGVVVGLARGGVGHRRRRERDGRPSGSFQVVEVDEGVVVVHVPVGVEQRVVVVPLEDGGDPHAGGGVPAPVRQREGVVADEVAEGALVEVDVHAVPRREDPGEVDVEGAVLLRRVQPVVAVAVGLVDGRLRREAQRVGLVQRPHLPDGLLVLGLVLGVQEVRRLPDARHLGLRREVDDGDPRRRRAREAAVRVRALHDLVRHLLPAAAALHGVRLQGEGDGRKVVRVPDEAGGDAAQAGEHLTTGQPKEAAVDVVAVATAASAAAGPALHCAVPPAPSASGILLGERGWACRGCRGDSGGRRDEEAAGGGGAGRRHAAWTNQLDYVRVR